MPVAAPLLVSPPALTPPRFGLLSVATIINQLDLHWKNGTEHVPNPVPSGATSGIDCAPAALSIDDDPMDIVTDLPMRVWADFSAKHPGLTADEIHERARLALSVSEGNLVEAAVWSTADTKIMGADTATPAGTSAVSLTAGLASMERWLYDSYGGTGVLHVAREVVPFLAQRQLVTEKNGRLLTTLGTPVAAGAYPGSGPTGTAAAAGTSWIAATGAVHVTRSEVRVPGENGPAYFDHRTNTVIGHAERVYVVGWENLQAASLITLEGP
ncbi:hypothetical protein [Gordonia sp. (in: high G+C Gram-positive bacteria)]|uniref:hypothetical protein n=1 Tax=Gordonia sp. (in: high G+C Gram-positive bacteria) TaxID=84139 RepID=UPI003342C678